jgi:hypothetical protein
MYELDTGKTIKNSELYDCVLKTPVALSQSFLNCYGLYMFN